VVVSGAAVDPVPVQGVVVGEGRGPVGPVEHRAREVDVLPGPHRERPGLAVRADVPAGERAQLSRRLEGGGQAVVIGQQARPVDRRARIALRAHVTRIALRARVTLIALRAHVTRIALRARVTLIALGSDRPRSTPGAQQHSHQQRLDDRASNRHVSLRSYSSPRPNALHCDLRRRAPPYPKWAIALRARSPHVMSPPDVICGGDGPARRYPRSSANGAMRFCFTWSQVISDEGLESLSVISAEVAADFWSGVDIDYEAVRVDWPMPIEDSRTRVFRRKERA